MRNSFNISGPSELVHEVLEDPREAAFGYTASGRYVPERGLTTWTGPALVGRVKSVRRFALTLDDGTGDDESRRLLREPTPLDLALAGLATCLLYTTVAGGTAREISFEALDVSVRADLKTAPTSAPEAGRLTDLVCHVHAVADAHTDTLERIAQQVSRHSPLHRTVLDSTSVRLPGGEPLGGERVGTDDHTVRREVRRRARWVSGTQFESRGDTDYDAVLRVDQPKQLGGVDWGPNPQEYLLMAVAAQLARLASRHQERRTRRAGVWTVHCHGQLDVRGLMGIDPDVPVGLHTVTVSVETPASATDEDLRAAAGEASLLDLLARPGTADVRITKGGAPVENAAA